MLPETEDTPDETCGIPPTHATSLPSPGEPRSRSNTPAAPDKVVGDVHVPVATGDEEDHEASSGGGAQTATAVEPSRSEEGPLSEGKGKGKEKAKAEDRFNCCICLDLAEDPVVTPCGHLSCWPCCHEWLVTSNKRTCPVCKALVTVDRLIPIYSSSGEEQKDPREIPLPPRPRPARAPSAPSTGSFFGIPFPASTLSSSVSTSSFSFHAGGLFPFSGVSMSYNYPPAYPSAHDPEDDGRAPGFDMRRGLVPGGEHEWMRQMFQQVFLVVFFAVFVFVTLGG